MPDVIIWMLRGEKRVAFTRIPANQVLYSNFSEQACGKHCGKTQTILMQVQYDLILYIISIPKKESSFLTVDCSWSVPYG